MNEVQEFGITEFRRRIRAISKVIRSSDGEVAVNSMMEIDKRTKPVAYPHLPTIREAFPSGDDLDEFMTLNDHKKWLSQAGVMQHGAVVHLRFHHTRPWGMHELINIFTVWMGTPDQEPVLIHAPACPMPEGHGPAIDTTETVD